MAKSLHLLLATVEDPDDPKSWSGTPFQMLRALEERFERVTVLSSRKPKRGLISAVLRLLLGRDRYPLWMTRTALKDYASKLDSLIGQARPDAVLCISSQHLIHAKASGLPVYMVSDSPWIAYKDAYKDYDPLPWLAGQYAAQEAAVGRKITGVIYPTPWACTQAMNRFGLGADKVDCIALGANRYCTDTADQVLHRIRHKAQSPLSLLFVGKDWKRKGGPLALQIVRQLNQRGCPSKLVIIGCMPAIAAEDAPHVLVLGFLSPSKPEDQRTLQAAFEKAHFFLVPSHAECFGLVFAEAQSYGLPCISLTNHGIPGVVDSGVTGLLFEPGTALSVMVDSVLALAQDTAAYQAMAHAARSKFDRELNWTTFGERTHQMIARACQTNPPLQVAL
jgi:glycosyltransferase involved in cell wall biosynthesis